MTNQQLIDCLNRWQYLLAADGHWNEEDATALTELTARAAVEPSAPRFLLDDTGINANDGVMHISIRFRHREAYEKALTFLDMGNAQNRGERQ